MGFWHTGYMEFHEPTRSDWVYEPTPILFLCQICNKKFTSMGDLRKHRFEIHRLTRPQMFIRGLELGAMPLQVTRPLLSADVLTFSVTTATVNGIVTPFSSIPQILSNIFNDRVTVVLANEGASSTFELMFRIAADEHLAGVETAFLKMAKSRTLTIRSIESFIADCKPFATASLYCDGLCHYLYGVLAKEHAPDSALGTDDYPSRFTQASDELQTYERTLAKIVMALVSFNFNHFEDAHNQTPPGRLHHAAVLFSGLIDGFPWHNEFERKESESNVLVDLLTDHSTLRILRWSELGLKDLANCTLDLQSQLMSNISDYDKFKIKMIFAEALAFKGDVVSARRVAREFMSNQQTQSWAESLVARLS